MTQNREKLVTFAHPMTISIGMETITLSYEPGSDFAKKLDELIRNSEGVRVVKKKKQSQPRKKRCVLDIAIQEEKEGEVQTFSSVDEVFEALGI